MSQANQWTNWAFWLDLTGIAAAQPCIFISVFRVPVQLKRLLLSEGSKGATATFLGVYRPSYQYQAGEDSSGFYSKLNCVPLLLSIERRSAVLSAAASATPGYQQWGTTSVLHNSFLAVTRAATTSETFLVLVFIPLCRLWLRLLQKTVWSPFPTCVHCYLSWDWRSIQYFRVIAVCAGPSRPDCRGRPSLPWPAMSSVSTAHPTSVTSPIH